MINSIGNVVYEKLLEELGLFTLEKRKLIRDLIIVFKYLKDAFKEGDRLFSVVARHRTTSNGFKLK